MSSNDFSSIQRLLIPVDSTGSVKASGDCETNTDQSWSGFASVLVPLIEIDSQWHLLLTLRSSKLRHHGGEVAFPGGMWEEGDSFPVDTALRESEEEVALPRSSVQVLGGLDEMNTRRFTRVFPVVGVVPNNQAFTPNEDEIESIFTVPLDFFIQDKRLRTDIFKRDMEDRERYLWVPAYHYEGYEIWGFTASVIVQLINRCFNANIQRKHSAPEQIW